MALLYDDLWAGRTYSSMMEAVPGTAVRVQWNRGGEGSGVILTDSTTGLSPEMNLKGLFIALTSAGL